MVRKRKTSGLEARAISGRWPIPDKTRERLITRLAGIVENKKASRREVTAAARALIAADSLNLAEEKANDGYTAEELLAKWQEAVAAGVEAELARRETRRIAGDAGDGDGTLVPASAVPAPSRLPGADGT